MAKTNQVRAGLTPASSAESVAIKQAFAPIIGKQPKIMILGSLPGEASLQVQQYYAHPRNQFWRLLSEISGVDLQSLPYADKIQQVQLLPVVIWDVVAQAQRQGSLDSAIRAAEIRDIAAMLREHPSIAQVWFNGGQAAKWGLRSLQAAQIDIHTLTLPSSSPAHTMAYALKKQQWQQAWDGVFLNH
ncbi:DNA-deoxyinosine glycosylase [Vitreoscilla massiliensis]|nr:DNA-deoxyinosine glycosylase [Vitreoscilla massiliensis]